MIKNYPQIKIFTYFKGSISTMYYKIIIINNIYGTKKNILALSPNCPHFTIYISFREQQKSLVSRHLQGL